MSARELYGMLAEFETPEELIAAAKEARAQGYRDLDTFTPFPVYELNGVLQLREMERQRAVWNVQNLGDRSGGHSFAAHAHELAEKLEAVVVGECA